MISVIWMHYCKKSQTYTKISVKSHVWYFFILARTRITSNFKINQSKKIKTRKKTHFAVLKNIEENVYEKSKSVKIMIIQFSVRVVHRSSLNNWQFL